jgi:hypothetical protein
VIRITGKCADLGVAEEAVTVTGYLVVGGIAQEARQQLEKKCGEAWQST